MLLFELAEYLSYYGQFKTHKYFQRTIFLLQLYPIKPTYTISIFMKLKRQSRMDNPETPATLGTRATERGQMAKQQQQQQQKTKQKTKNKQTKTEKMSNTNPQKTAMLVI